MKLGYVLFWIWVVLRAAIIAALVYIIVIEIRRLRRRNQDK